MSLSARAFKVFLDLGAHQLKRPSCPYTEQIGVLRTLVSGGMATDFGRLHGFKELWPKLPLLDAVGALPLEARKEVLLASRAYFSKHVPLYTYEELWKKWWSLAYCGVPNLSWPGRVKHFAVTSSTTSNTLNRVPVSYEMKRCIRHVMFCQLYAVPALKLCSQFYEGMSLSLESTSVLKKTPYGTKEGFISGIMADSAPLWTRMKRLPRRPIGSLVDWREKMDAITYHAPTWNVSSVVGSPPWTQLLIEHLMDRYKLSSIHDLWPNLSLYIHGGVSIDTYEEQINKYFKHKVQYLETYLASEGFFAYQEHACHTGMRLACSSGVFYEFIPFDSTQQSLEDKQALSIAEVELNKPYALCISTVAGLWRYQLGDVISFVSRTPPEITILGRVKHCLNVCKEGVSIDQMHHVIESYCTNRGLQIPEFCAYGLREGKQFGHKWFFGMRTEAHTLSADVAHQMAKHIDEQLCEINIDYCEQRNVGMLNLPEVRVIPLDTFYDWMSQQGRLGGQYKFPRVLKDDQIQHWLHYLKSRQQLKN